MVCVGTNPSDMALAINEVIRIGGGLAVVDRAAVVETLALPVGGIVADIDVEMMAAAESRFDAAARRLLRTLLGALRKVLDQRVRPREEESLVPVLRPTDLVRGASVRTEHLQYLGGPVRLGNGAAPDYKVIPDFHIHRRTSSRSGSHRSWSDGRGSSVRGERPEFRESVVAILPSQATVTGTGRMIRAVTEPGSFLVTPEDLRRHGRRTVDWVADYLTRLESYPVLATTVPGEIAAMLPRSAPEQPEPFEAVLADLDRIVLPGTTHWQSPGFFGFFPANASPPAILGELVTAGLGVNGMGWETSPACTEVETVMLDWLVELLGLPARFRSESRGGGVIQDSASSATLCALLAARERAINGGAVLADLCVYTSAEAHSSVQKGARVAGFSPERVRLIAVDEAFGMDLAALESAVHVDREAGLVPCCVVATAGTTSSMAFDPVRAIGELCRAERAWLHVDAAMAGSAAVCPELRSQHDGLELADSYAFNPHKWLLTNFDCDCLYLADRASLIDALSITPEYLRNDASESGAVLDYRDWQVPLGRRFRALKLWFVLRCYGAEGLRRHVREHVRLSRHLTGLVVADPRFELCAPPALNLTCFRHVGGDDVSERLLAELNATGRVFLSHTRLAGHYVIRCCIGGTWTTERHVAMLWDLIDELAPEP